MLGYEDHRYKSAATPKKAAAADTTAKAAKIGSEKRNRVAFVQNLRNDIEQADSIRRSGLPPTGVKRGGGRTTEPSSLALTQTRLPQSFNCTDSLFEVQFNAAFLAFLDQNPSFRQLGAAKLSRLRTQKLMSMLRERTEGENELSNQLVMLKKDKEAKENDLKQKLLKVKRDRAKQQEELIFQIQHVRGEVDLIEKEAQWINFRAMFEQLSKQEERKVKNMVRREQIGLGVDEEDLERKKFAYYLKHTKERELRKVRYDKIAMSTGSP